MKYNLLGNTGLQVSELCLGTMTFGGKGFWEAIGKSGQDVANDIISQSIAAGINFIDTANVYSEGLSEEITGKALRDLGINRDEIVLATKVRGRMGKGPNQVGLSRSHIMHQVEESLRRLQTDYIDLYQIHGFDPLTPLEETVRTLDDLVKSGKVRYIGCSNLSSWQIMKALAYSQHTGLARFESLQAYYTIAGRDLERELVPLLKDQKVGLMVWSPLAGGLLSGKYRKDKSGPDGSRRVDFDFPPVNKERAFSVVDALNPMATERNCSIARLALAWLLKQDVVTSVIIGAKNRDQLDDNLKAVDIDFTEVELNKLDEISQLPAEYPGWMLERQGANRKIGN
ncbi:aryl-alcohol dehydrogenase-like predicted oxidoreductase [Catalinimonas alkaloidigena]|uniref:aldo/keto reductase n=1 Tax=Catalinimonas alkaloidigena TaxID=1075417 RepID=UPI0024063EC8|nr:aldo/keto reductase [Catalinimonas alkaloidigena]MDF9797360.1 aryl-alcohol dehydrogenase-like predicted oxidoreductase [Catalinimonas alkaloidigena]